jgi:hypothetical protein
MDFISAIETALGRKAEIDFQPLQPGDVPATYADVEDLVQDLQYKPDTPVQSGHRSLCAVVSTILRLMFDWFKSKPSTSDFGFLGLDFHSHLVPGVDDGAKDAADAVRLLSQLQDLGFTKAITTPHIMSDLYPNTPQVLREGFAVLQSQPRRRRD